MKERDYLINLDLDGINNKKSLQEIRCEGAWTEFI
jgi:hypothetical protein